MSTIQIKAYKYEELSEKAKEKVKYWLDEGTNLFDQYEQEIWEEDLAQLGYEDCDFAYSVSYSQGDGASIACSVNVRQFIKRHKLGKKYASLLYWLRKVYNDGFRSSATIKVRRSRMMNYVHEYMLDADANNLIDELNYYDAPAKPVEQAERLGELILEEVREQSRKLYKQLCDADMWHYEDEYVIDMCESNEYLFDVYGNPVHHLQEEIA